MTTHAIIPEKTATQAAVGLRCPGGDRGQDDWILSSDVQLRVTILLLPSVSSQPINNLQFHGLKLGKRV